MWVLVSMKWIRNAIVGGLLFSGGFLLGLAVIHRPMPDAPVELPPERVLMDRKNLMGLVGSAGIRSLAGHLKVLPVVVLETDKTFVLNMPTTRNRVHFVMVPKKDILDFTKLGEVDEPYLLDIFLTARSLVEKYGISDYYISTNGPDLQTVAYLHFHLYGKIKTPKK
jgi:hypothetical protein